MGELFNNIRLILEDFRSSWYFRVWGTLWLVCFVVGFSGFVVLTSRSSQAAGEKNWNIWVENATTLAFPPFHVRFPLDSNGTFEGTPVCLHMGQPVVLHPCYGDTVRSNKCFAVLSGIEAHNKWNAPWGDNRIDCTFVTTGNTGNQDNNLMAFELYSSLGGVKNDYTATWFGPRDFPGTWIMLRKNLISGFREEFAAWRTSLLYHSTVTQAGRYALSVELSTFRVEHITETDAYNGWMAMGDAGGFFYWLIILHTIVMIAIGVVLRNDAKFLQPGSVAERSVL